MVIYETFRVTFVVVNVFLSEQQKMDVLKFSSSPGMSSNQPYISMQDHVRSFLGGTEAWVSNMVTASNQNWSEYSISSQTHDGDCRVYPKLMHVIFIPLLININI